ncbi:hypothetical protein FRC02_005627 [Tulasnella sp. 418]|nr:hypothetical protein FRC02_005627 [Tulasnella sp. 418]
MLDATHEGNWLRSVARRCVEVARSGLNIVRSAASTARSGLQWLWRQWQRVPKWLRWSVYGLLAFAAFMLILYLIGFTPAGVAAGSLAAAWHSSIGIVAAGSLFSVLQSLTMAATAYIVLGAGAGVLGGLVAWFMSRGPRDDDEDVIPMHTTKRM